MEPRTGPPTTTDSGIPAESDEYSLTVGQAGRQPCKTTTWSKRCSISTGSGYPRGLCTPRAVGPRVLRGHGGRQLVHSGQLPGRGRQTYRDVRPLLDGGR